MTCPECGEAAKRQRVHNVKTADGIVTEVRYVCAACDALWIQLNRPRRGDGRE